MPEAAGRGGVAQGGVSLGDKSFAFCKQVCTETAPWGYSSTDS